jgi:hypothetical protein
MMERGVSSTAAVGNMGMGEAEAEADSSNISLHFLESYLALEHAYHRIQNDIVKFMVLLSHGLGLLRVMVKEKIF